MILCFQRRVFFEGALYQQSRYLPPLALTMASFEDYDEFGNYIGADLDSDEEGDVPSAAHAPLQQPLEGYEDEPMSTDPGMALMEVDGEFCS
jgi:hypothetical protein